MWYGVVESSSLYCVVRVRIKKRIASVFKKSQSISIGTCCLELYVFYLFETSGTASCGSMLYNDDNHTTYVNRIMMIILMLISPLAFHEWVETTVL